MNSWMAAFNYLSQCRVGVDKHKMAKLIRFIFKN